jgi:hypothetical protein
VCVTGVTTGLKKIKSAGAEVAAKKLLSAVIEAVTEQIVATEASTTNPLIEQFGVEVARVTDPVSRTSLLITAVMPPAPTAADPPKSTKKD